VVSVFGGVGTLWGVAIRSAFKASSRILALLDMRCAYLLYFGCLESLNLLSRRGASTLSLSMYFFSWVSDRVVLRNSFNSSICMNLVALVRSSSKLFTGFLHRLSTNGPGFNVVIRWCMATSRFKLEIFNVIFPNRSINSRTYSPFSCRIFTNARKVRWYGLLVANWMPKRVTNVSKQSIELGGNRVHQLSAGPFRDVGKTRQRIVSSEVSNPAWVVNTSTCSPRSVVPSYWLRVNPFQRAGSSTSMIPSTKGWCLVVLGLAPVWLVVIYTLDSSRLVSPSPSPLLWDSSLCCEFCSICLHFRWFSSLRAFISSSFLRLNSSN